MNATSIRAVGFGVALLAGALTGTAAVAQQKSRVDAGERIRVSYYDPAAGVNRPSPARRTLGAATGMFWPRRSNPVPNTVVLTGLFVAADDEALLIATHRAVEPTAVSTGSIALLEVHRRTANLARPIAIGAGMGAVGLPLLGLMAPCFGSCPDASAGELLSIAATGAVVGALAGAGYGLLHPWHRVRLPVAPLAGANRGPNVGVTATLAF